MASPQEQIDALQTELAAQRLIVTTMKATVDSQADQIDRLYRALMVPEPGETRSLLDRMAGVTRSVESGGKVQAAAVKAAQGLAALGAIWAALHWGGPKL